MKKVTIFQKNIKPLEILDDEKITNEEYSRKIADILDSSVISFIHTSAASVVVRPNTIYSILIEDVKEPEFFDISYKQPEKIEEEKNENENLDTDIITD